MHDVPLLFLAIALVSLLLISAFFSGSETALMAANRYRLRHLAKNNHTSAKRVLSLLERTDRLLGMILIGNTFANILAASLATIIGVRLLGELGIAVSTIVLTLVVLVCSEVTPKTLAALFPEKFAYIVSRPLKACMWLLRPLVAFVSLISTGFLRLMGVKQSGEASWSLTREELRTLVHESGEKLGRNQNMLIRLLDLRKVTVDDIMVPRNEIVGIDLQNDWSDIEKFLLNSQHGRLAVFDDDINNLKGIIHLRELLNQVSDGLTKDGLMNCIRPADFVLEGTALTTQLLNFQEKKTRVEFVVDEYGDIQGLVTLEDILEEIVGEFTTDVAAISPDVYPQDDGSYVVDGSANLRELNRKMKWRFNTTGPKTMSGLITEYLEAIPQPGTCCKISDYPIEIMQVKDNMVKTARVFPPLI